MNSLRPRLMSVENMGGSFTCEFLGAKLIFTKRKYAISSATSHQHRTDNGKGDYYELDYALAIPNVLDWLPKEADFLELTYTNPTYYNKLAAEIDHVERLRELGIKNDRQLVITDPVECISMIHIIPRVDGTSVFVYQRSAMLGSITDDIMTISSYFRDYTDLKPTRIYWMIANLHAFMDLPRNGQL